MAFNTLEYLKIGNIDFVYQLTLYDRDSLIKRVRRSENKNEIINGFLPKLLSVNPSFCFEIIYDNDAFENETKWLISEGQQLTGEKALNIIRNTSWGKSYVFSKFASIPFTEEELDTLFQLLFEDYASNSKYIEFFKCHTNLHLRYLFMKFILKNYEDLFEVIYPNIMLYLTSVTYREGEQLTLYPDLMDSEDICELALLILNSKYRDKYFLTLKEYIINNYPQNDLAMVLLAPRLERDSNGFDHFVTNEEAIKEFTQDAERLFLTSATEKFNIIKKYPNLISKEILDRYKAYYQRFRPDDSNMLRSVYFYRLGDVLLQLIDKYLSLSTNANWRYIGAGSTGIVYQMGNYVLKLFRTKWSYEEVICPNLFLILKAFEEMYVRDNDGIVKCGIEVQTYLEKDASHLPESIFELFKEELARLGYRYTDKLIGGQCGDNCKLLNSYLDADCQNPEALPTWFKENPVVLIDRDRIYRKDQKYIRQRTTGY